MKTATRGASLVVVLALVGCEAAPDPGHAHTSATYDPSGKLMKVDLDRDKNGKTETFSYWDGSRLQRIEIDQDEDGRIDRWEHYDVVNKMIKVGSSSRDDQVEDTWVYPDKKGFLKRQETDADRDGFIDKREIFVIRPGTPGQRVISIVELGLDRSGRPSHRLHYRPNGQLERTERLRPR